MIWLEAARPKTLSAAVTPVLVGTAAVSEFILWRFVAAMVVALALQVGVNYANDYFDAQRGVDTEKRTGPRRAVSAGLVSPAAMRNAMLIAFGVAAVAGVALAAAAGWWLIAVGAVSFAAAVGYSGGSRPYASSGLGELFVFVFFGLVATVGSAYVQAESVPPLAVLVAIPVGMLAMAILVANNLRDIQTDAAAGKRTLSVRLGDPGSRLLFSALLVAPFAFVPVIAFLVDSFLPLLAMLALVFALSAVRTARSRARGRALIPMLVSTARTQLAFGVLLSAGLFLV